MTETVLCTQCGDPTRDHVGVETPNPDCECCSWRQNESKGRYVTGPLGLPMWREDSGRA